MKILVVGDSYMPVEVFRKGLARLAPDHELDFVQLDEQLTYDGDDAIGEFAGSPAQLVEALDAHEALVVHAAPVTSDVLAAPSLRVVCCARGGPVNVDVEAATERGIPVVTTPGKNAESVADLTLAFLVMLARRLPVAQRFLLDGNVAGESVLEGARFLGHDLVGRTLGLVGFGNVGRRVAERARAFGMDVLVYDPFQDVDGVASLHELLVRSDFVSLHARATPENENLMDAAAFGAMQPGSYFVNTARETLVDEDALEDALRSGRLAGAALDVVRPRADRHPLLDYDNVVLTPHVGGATHETLLRGATMVADELQRLAAGDAPENVINREAVRA